jgi:hypothetical protein
MENTHWKLLNEWQNGLKVRHIAHNLAAMTNQQKGNVLGIISIGFTASVAVSAGLKLQILSGVLSGIATIIISIQKFCKYAENGEKHKAAADNYGNLHREVEVIIETWDEKEDTKKILQDLEVKWSALDAKSPIIPEKIYAQASSGKYYDFATNFKTFNVETVNSDI